MTSPIPERRLAQGLEATVVALASLGVAAVHLAPLGKALEYWEGGWGAALLGRDATKPVLGDGVDLLGNLWNMDYAARLLTGQAGRFEPDLFAPIGQDLARTTGLALLDGMLAFPLVAGMGAVGGYNLYLLLLLIADTVALHLLFRALRAPAALALALALAVMLHPFVATEILQGRPNQAHLLFPALFLALLFRMTRADARPLWLGPLAGLALAAYCHVYPFGAMAMGLFAAGVVGLQLILNPGRRAALAAGAAVGGVVTAAGVLLPLLPALDTLLATSRQSAEAAREGRVPVRHALESLGSLPAVLGDVGWLPYLLALGLLPLLARRAWRTSLPWALPAWAASTLPFGAVVVLGEARLPTAFAAARWLIPPLARCHNPDRLLPVPLLGLLCAVAITGGWLLARQPEPRRRLATVLAAVAVLMAATLSRPTLPAATSRPLAEAEFYTRVVAKQPGGIVDVPLWASNREFHYQLVHRQPLLGGPGICGTKTRPAGHADYVQDNSLLRGLEFLALEPDAALPGFSREDHSALWEAGFRTVVVHRDRTDTDPDRFVELLAARRPLRAGKRVSIPIPDPGRRSASIVDAHGRPPAPSLPADRIHFPVALDERPPHPPDGDPSR